MPDTNPGGLDSTSLPIGNIHSKVLPPATNAAHHLLGNILSPRQRRQLTIHNLPRQMIRERILRSDLLAIFRRGTQRRINPLNEKAVAHSVGDVGDFGI